MSLIVVFTNRSALAEVSDYNVGVFINEHQLYGGEVRGHVRAEGWEKLVTQFTNQLNKTKNDQWHEYRRQLLEAWANDSRATMTVLLEEGYPR